MMKNAYPKRIAKFSALAIFGLATLVGCEQNEVEPESVDINTLVVPGSFNYNTSQTVQVSVSAVDGQKNPIKLTYFQIFDKDPDEGGKQLFVGSMDDKGQLNTSLTLPTSLTSVVLVSNFIGLISEVEVAVSNGKIAYDYTMGGSSNKRLNSKAVSQKVTTTTGFETTYGVPNDLVGPNQWNVGAITAATNAEFLSDITISTLPERTAVPTSYINDNVQPDIHVTELADVWITFLHEGGDYRSSMGYYTYKISDGTPTNLSQINKTFLFPNASYPNSGGNLAGGSTVHLGQFPAGTGIGFFLVVNGWDTTNKKIGNGMGTIYSHAALNPRSLKQSVVLKDATRDLLVIGFEDKLVDDRNYANTAASASDKDYNDVMFIASSNPIKATTSGNFVEIKKGSTDTDKDGVSDTRDAYRNDPERAYNFSTVGSLAFEDKWPSKGDFDMNDLVLDYEYKLITNAKNQTKEVIGTYSVAAIGAARHNGFGIELPVISSNVETLTVDGNIVKVEQDLEKATFTVFKDAFSVVNFNDGFFNTDPKNTKQPIGKTSFKFVLGTPIYIASTALFNPFLLIDGDRTKEVHLAGYTPTLKANTKLFGTADDNTKGGTYYKTIDNLPYAIDIAGKFNYPIEKASITEAYQLFAEWAISGGGSKKDWYSNTAAGYRNTNKIFLK